jgi:hypothetical protein
VACTEPSSSDSIRGRQPTSLPAHRAERFRQQDLGYLELLE